MKPGDWFRGRRESGTSRIVRTVTISINLLNPQNIYVR